jgi:hypothetical protein
VVDALLGARAELAACVRDDAARADMWAVHAAMGGLLAAELAGARWPVVVAVVRLAWRCCAVLVRWGVAAELETRRRRLAAGHGEVARRAVTTAVDGRPTVTARASARASHAGL